MVIRRVKGPNWLIIYIYIVLKPLISLSALLALSFSLLTKKDLRHVRTLTINIHACFLSHAKPRN